jgi:hypothetical protein
VSDSSSSDKRRRQDPVYLSQGRFAQRADISRQTLWRWLKTGYVRSIKLSPTITRIHVSELDRIAQESEHKQPSPRKRRKYLGAEQRDDDPQEDPPETD